MRFDYRSPGSWTTKLPTPRFKVSRERRGVKLRRIEGQSRQQLHRWIGDACAVARAWCDAAEYAQDTGRNWLVDQAGQVAR